MDGTKSRENISTDSYDLYQSLINSSRRSL
jgi:hypothetical protein